MYTVTTNGMGEHINAKDYSESFETLESAIKAFNYQCSRLDYDNIEVNEDGTRDAGGIGFDYRIELFVNDGE